MNIKYIIHIYYTPYEYYLIIHMICKITFDDSKIYTIDNDIYQSRLLDNCNNYKNEIIYVNLPLYDFYFSYDTSNLHLGLIRDYIIFWDYMLSDKYFYKGIYELCFNKRRFVKKNKIIKISESINELVEYLLKTNIEQYANNCKYYTLLKIMMDYKYDYKNILLNPSFELFNYCNLFSSFGNLECLQYAHKKGYTWNHYTTIHASNGHLDCLKYLHENGCKWTWHVFTNASYMGHVECFKYAFENDCPHPTKYYIFQMSNDITYNYLKEYIDKMISRN